MLERRLIHDGDEFTIDDYVEFERPERRPEPLTDIQGEPWGWTKPGPRPKGWPGPNANLDEPGPFDGSWELHRGIME